MNVSFKKIIFFVAVAWLHVPATITSQQPKGQMLSKQVSSFELTEANLSQVLETLAKTYKVPIGFEVIPTASDVQTNKKISINIAKGTVRDVLEATVRADPRYRWEVVDEVINVYPKEIRSPVLEFVVQNFQLELTNKQDATRVITDLPEVKAKLDQVGLKRRDVVSSTRDYQSMLEFSLNLQNMTVRRILNEIMIKSGSNYWIYLEYDTRHIMIRM